MWTAWLKYYYPTEFMYAILKNEKNDKTRLKYFIEAKRLKIKILLPHINKSGTDFKLEDDAIWFGLGDIKSISPDKGAVRILAEAPYESYREFSGHVATKGSGINSRMVDSLNAIGAASFPDNPLRGDESDNLYEYLSVPKFKNGNLSPKIMARINTLDEFEETGCFIYLAMVTEIKRGKGWSRVELVDETGTIGLFHSEQTSIEPGQMYLILAADNRIARFIAIDDVERSQDDALVRFLEADEIKIPDDKWVVLSFTTLTTKAGKKYAHAVIADREKNMHRVIIFHSNYPKALDRFKRGAVVKLSLSRLDDDSLYVKDILND
jgi:DNA polymerase-3 subunit alpha